MTKAGQHRSCFAENGYHRASLSNFAPPSTRGAFRPELWQHRADCFACPNIVLSCASPLCGDMREHAPGILGRERAPISLAVTLARGTAIDNVRGRIGVDLVADQEQHLHAG